MFELKATQLGQRMRAIRNELNLSLRACASALGVSYSCLSKYETGARFPHIQLVWKYVTLYHANYRYLLLGIGEMFDTTPLVIDSPDCVSGSQAISLR